MKLLREALHQKVVLCFICLLHFAVGMIHYLDIRYLLEVHSDSLYDVIIPLLL